MKSMTSAPLNFRKEYLPTPKRIGQPGGPPSHCCRPHPDLTRRAAAAAMVALSSRKYLSSIADPHIPFGRLSCQSGIRLRCYEKDAITTGKFYLYFFHPTKLSAYFSINICLAANVLLLRADEVAHRGHQLRGFRPESSLAMAPLSYSCQSSIFLPSPLIPGRFSRSRPRIIPSARRARCITCAPRHFFA
jgi:hypothetical protein